MPNAKKPTGLLGKLSLNAKILVSLIGALVIGLAATATFISQKSARTTEEISVQSGKQLAATVAADVKRDLDMAMRLTETLRDAFVSLRNSDTGISCLLPADVLANLVPPYYEGQT